MSRRLQWGIWMLGLGAALAAGAQSPPQPLSIEDALRRAESYSENVAAARAGVDRGRAAVTRARSEWMPQVNGVLSYERTLASEFEGLDFGPPPGTPGAEEVELPFGQPNVYRIGASASYNLYAGGRSSATHELARAQLKTAELSLASARAQVVLEAVQTYLDAVLSERLLKIAESSFAQAERTLQQTKLGRERGTRPEFDLLRAQVALENQRPTLLQRRMDQRMAHLRLKQLLELPLDQELQLTTQLEGELTDLAAPAREISGAPEPTTTRVQIQQAGEAVRMRQSAVDIAFSQHLPQLNASMNYGLVAYPNTWLPRPQDFRFSSNDELRDNWTVGLTLSIPLFSGLRVTGDVDSARADLVEARARLKQAEEGASLDARSAEQQLATAQATWEASSGVVEQAKKAFEIAEIRYREGISTQLELADAQLLYEQAAANRARAGRDLQVARVRMVLLPVLPVSMGGAGFAGAGASAGAGGFDPSMGAGAGMQQGGGAGAGAGGGTTGAAQGGAGAPTGF